MGKYLFLTTLTFSLLTSCKKDNPGSSGSDSYYFTATIDGTAQSFIKPTATTGGMSPTTTQDYFEGFTTADTVNPAIRIGWLNTAAGTNLGVGTWSDTSANYVLTADYLVNPFQGYGAGNYVVAYADSAGVAITNHLKLTITAMDAYTVKGTFSGDFYYENVPAAAKKTITGDFYLLWK